MLIICLLFALNTYEILSEWLKRLSNENVSQKVIEWSKKTESRFRHTSHQDRGRDLLLESGYI